MRHHLMQDYTQVFHLDLHGNVRKNPKLSGTTHNVFGIQIGVGITIAVRSSNSPTRGIYYHRVPGEWRREQKLAFLADCESSSGIDWQELHPDETHTWLTEGLHAEFDTFVAVGTRDAKLARVVESGGTAGDTIFKLFSLGANTARDPVAYNFDRNMLTVVG